MARPPKPTEYDDGPDHELDLHGLRGEQALRRLAQELHAWRISGVRRALIITGRGIQSEAGAVLAPLVENWLGSQEARKMGIAGWKSTHRGGAFDVDLSWDERGRRRTEDERA